MKKLFLLLCAACVVTACSDDENPAVPAPVQLATPDVTYEIVGPHAVVLSWNGVENAAAYSYAIDTQAPERTTETGMRFDPDGRKSCTVTVTALSGDASRFLDSEPCVVTVADIPDDPIVPERFTVDFEAAELGSDGFIWGKDDATEQDDTDYNGNPIRSNIFYGSIYAEKGAEFDTYYTDYGHTYDAWSAFVVSNHTDMETAGYTNDKSVYATTGADGSAQFAVGYYNAWAPENRGVPTVRFASAVTPVSVYVANPTYVYCYFRDEVAAADKPEFKVVATGYDGQTKTGEASIVLAGGTEISEGWRPLDLKDLGRVTRIEFSVVCADAMAPTYLCIDNLAFSE